MIDILGGFPFRDVRGQHVPKAEEGIEAGHMVFLNEDSELELAVGAAGEYAMVALNDQPEISYEQGNQVAVLKENASFATDKFKSGVTYDPHCRLQVSVTQGEEGILTVYDNQGTAPVVGRFEGWKTVFGTTLMAVNLSRS